MAPPAEHPYASFVHLVQKPARYLGGEFGARRKDWDAVEARVCLAFPDVYDIGMSHLGFKILYKILNDDPRTLAERAYAPWVDMEAQLRAATPAARLVRERAAAARLRRRRLLAPVRAHVHERPHDARPRRHPAAGRRPRRRRSARHRRRADGDAPRAARAVPRRGRHRRRRGAPHRGRARVVAREEGAACDAPSGSARSRASRACTSRRSTRRGSTRTRGSRSSIGPPGVDVPLPVVRTHRRRPEPVSRSPTTARSAAPRRSSTACRSRSPAAAPRAAASARRG